MKKILGEFDELVERLDKFEAKNDATAEINPTSARCPLVAGNTILGENSFQ